MQNNDSTMFTQQSNVMRVQRPKCKSVQNQVINYSQDVEEDNNAFPDYNSWMCIIYDWLQILSNQFDN